jgi:hypothetical protein
LTYPGVDQRYSLDQLTCDALKNRRLDKTAKHCASMRNSMQENRVVLDLLPPFSLETIGVLSFVPRFQQKGSMPSAFDRLHVNGV